MKRFCLYVLLAPVLAGLGGCETLRRTPAVDLVKPGEYKQVGSVPMPEPKATPTGGIYRTESYRPAFERPRARMVGDLLTVQILENVDAKQSSSSSVDRSSAVDGSVTSLPLVGTSLNTRLKAGAKSSNVFEGKGGTESAHTFTGIITASVVEVLPNGYLVVYGEKQIGLNENVDVLKFSGTVDPRIIRSDNTINSTEVANARIFSGSRGAQGEAQAMGWAARLFLSVLPF